MWKSTINRKQINYHYDVPRSSAPLSGAWSRTSTPTTGVHWCRDDRCSTPPACLGHQLNCAGSLKDTCVTIEWPGRGCYSHVRRFEITRCWCSFRFQLSPSCCSRWSCCDWWRSRSCATTSAPSGRRRWLRWALPEPDARRRTSGRCWWWSVERSRARSFVLTNDCGNERSVCVMMTIIK